MQIPIETARVQVANLARFAEYPPYTLADNPFNSNLKREGKTLAYSKMIIENDLMCTLNL